MNIPIIFRYDESQIVSHDDITYLIDPNKNTASIIQCDSHKEEIIIPRSIFKGTVEYTITSISKRAFSSSGVKSIQFSEGSELQMIDNEAFSSLEIKSFTLPSHVKRIGKCAFSSCINLQNFNISVDSELETIEKRAFFGSKIEYLFVPSKLINLKKGWCSSMAELTKIQVSPKNPKYSLFEEKMMVGKSTEKLKNYDSIVFCLRNIESITIPSFIKYIEAYSFNKCERLRKIKILPKSKLLQIGKEAFSHTSIEKVILPLHLNEIGKYCFSNCSQLNEIEIPENSQLHTIEYRAFFNSPIKSLTIRTSILNLIDGWCSTTPKLVNIKVSPNNPYFSCIDDKVIIEKSSSEMDFYDTIVFGARNIKSIKIPNCIEYIQSSAFQQCSLLQKVDIPNDSNLKLISCHSFSETAIEYLSIPSHLLQIDDCAFTDCVNLRKIESSSSVAVQAVENISFKFMAQSSSAHEKAIRLRNIGFINVLESTTKTSELMAPLRNMSLIFGQQVDHEANHSTLINISKNDESQYIPYVIKDEDSSRQEELYTIANQILKKSLGESDSRREAERLLKEASNHGCIKASIKLRYNEDEIENEDRKKKKKEQKSMLKFLDEAIQEGSEEAIEEKCRIVNKWYNEKPVQYKIKKFDPKIALNGLKKYYQRYLNGEHEQTSQQILDLIDYIILVKDDKAKIDSNILYTGIEILLNRGEDKEKIQSLYNHIPENQRTNHSINFRFLNLCFKK